MGVTVGGLTSLMWSVVSGREFKSIFCVAYSPDGRTIASGYGNGTIYLRHMVDGEPPRTQDLHATMQGVFSVAFTPDGQTLAAGCHDNAIRLWRVADGKLLGTLQEHTGPVRGVAFSSDGRTLASAGDDGQVILYRLGPW
jgi:WD40 repeat protein